MSFGGTALLGVPQVLERLSSVLMVGSGCGKSPDTKKPLLSTLPESDSLLNSLIGFTGTFVFLRGSEDTIVPQEAQRRIFESAHHAESRAWIEYKGLDHKLSNGKDVQLARLIAKHVRQS